MTIEITRPGKSSVMVETPVMPAAGTVGFGDEYKDLIKLEKLGALVTNPVTYQPWQPATGTRVVPLDAGLLIHTGLPNPGVNKVIEQHRTLWATLSVPVIVHLVGTTVDQVRRGAARLDEEDSVDAIELGLNDDCSWQEVEQYVKAAASSTDKPVLARLPLNDVYTLARAADDAGAGAVVIAAAPRGTARDLHTGRLVSGRVYGPLVKPMTLRVVGQVANKLDLPVIGAGGIHTQQDARDYLEAGARAVQVDSVTWVDPKILEWIARDLGGLVLTRQSGALSDEWNPGTGITETKAREEAKRRQQEAARRKTPPAGGRP